MRRKKTLIVVGSVLAFILISCGAFIVYFSIIPILNWKTFDTEDFSLRYPQNWETRLFDNRGDLRAGKGEIIELEVELSPPEGEYLTIGFTRNPERFSLLEFFRNQRKKYGYLYPSDSEVSEASQFNLAGIQGIRVYKSGSSQTYPWVEIYLSKGDKVYEINCSLREERVTEDICIKILSTFNPKD